MPVTDVNIPKSSYNFYKSGNKFYKKLQLPFYNMRLWSYDTSQTIS